MRILLVTSRYPLPAWRGNQVRTMEWIEALADHDLDLMCPRPGRGPELPDTVTRHHNPLGLAARGVGFLRAAVGGRPFQEGLYDTAASQRAVARLVRQQRPDVVVVQMVRCGWAVEAVRAADEAVPLVFDAIDAMGLHFERAASALLPPVALAYRLEAGRCRRREREIAETAHVTVAVSDRDLKAMAVPDGRGRVIPVGGRSVESKVPTTDDPVVLLSGNLGYRPTVEAALWFAREVWPRVRAAAPDARWVLAGARPAPSVRQLDQQDGVEVHADVPELETYLREARVAVAPMSSGSGVPMKVLEAMAAALPVVVHPWAADGLVEDARVGVTVASEPEEWATIVTRLLVNPQAAADLGHRGHELWRRFYHPDRVADQIRAVVEEAAE